MHYNMNEIIGQNDVILMTLDTLRYDVAQGLWEAHQLPNFEKWLSPEGWELRHSPGSFTYAAHHAFFAGFLPTPARPGKHPRLFASRFAGAETAVERTVVFDEDNIVEGLEAKGYRTICIGGVGFFNKKTALSRVFPSLFQESYWTEEFGVTEKESTNHQFEKAAELLDESSQKTFLFINISAMHQPNYFYEDGATDDDLNSHAAALQYVDRQLPILQEALAKRGKYFLICTADHGTTYGEEGYYGHRLAHPMVWNVPYTEGLIG